MRFHLLGLILLAGTAAPALAQSDRIERRVEKLERDVAAVQRRVSGNDVQPEIRPSTQVTTGGIPASDATADLNARLDSLEAQLARLTGASEENANRIRQLEGALSEYRLTVDRRLQDMTSGAAEPAAGPQPRANVPGEPAASPDRAPATAAEAPSTGDPAEDAYLIGFRQWEAGQFAAAQKSLEAMAKKYPKHRRASYALNLAGRAHLDAGQPATAAKILLSNYQADAKGERAADSLYFLGQALVALKKPANACKVYEELQTVYGESMRDWLKQRLPKAREDAKCS